VIRHKQDTANPLEQGADLLSLLVGWLVGWLVKFWLGLRNPLFLPAYESEMRRNNVALLPDIYFIVSKNVPT